MNYRKPVIVFALTAAVAYSSFAFKTFAQSPTDQLPPIPTADSAVRTKEVGITIFGFTIPGITLDGLFINGIVKPTITQIVNSTVNWINNGFDGNPAFVTNPKQYFKDIADGIAGEFIEGSDLNFLCSPFQAQIRLALKKSYTQPRQFQCTFTEAIGNLENFYNDFDEGGWDAWFRMTQNNQNNPYGTYLDTKIELDARIAEAVKIKADQLNQGRGFLSYERCKTQFAGPSQGTTLPNGDVGPTQNLQPGDCIEKEIVTPGAAIEGQLTSVLGTGIRQLELADEFDEIVGALMGQLLQRTIFTALGLRGAPNNASGGPPGPAGSGTGSLPPPPPPINPPDPAQVCSSSCAANYCPAASDNDSSLCDWQAYNSCVNECIADSTPPPSGTSTPLPPATTPATPPPSGQVGLSASISSGSAPLNAVTLTATNGEPGQFYYYFFCDRPEDDSPPPIPSGFNNSPTLVSANTYTDPVTCSYPSAGTYRPKVISFKLLDESGVTVSPIVYREAWATIIVTAP